MSKKSYFPVRPECRNAVYRRERTPNKLLQSLTVILLLFPLTMFCQSPTFTVMLDPAGDAQHTGRIIDDTFERSVTLQCCEAIKKELEAINPSIRVVLTRFPGERVEPLQNANFANRLNVDLFISLHCYKEQHTKPHVYIFTYLHGQEAKPSTSPLTLCPVDQIHTHAHHQSAHCAQLAYELFSTAFDQQFTTHSVLQLPFAPLQGVRAPAFGLEVGIKEKNDWSQITKPLSQLINALTCVT